MKRCTSKAKLFWIFTFQTSKVFVYRQAGLCMCIKRSTSFVLCLVNNVVWPMFAVRLQWHQRHGLQKHVSAVPQNCIPVPLWDKYSNVAFKWNTAVQLWSTLLHCHRKKLLMFYAQSQTLAQLHMLIKANVVFVTFVKRRTEKWLDCFVARYDETLFGSICLSQFCKLISLRQRWMDLLPKAIISLCNSL